MHGRAAVECGVCVCESFVFSNPSLCAYVSHGQYFDVLLSCTLFLSARTADAEEEEEAGRDIDTTW